MWYLYFWFSVLCKPVIGTWTLKHYITQLPAAEASMQQAGTGTTT
jgi:hypothetical protein